MASNLQNQGLLNIGKRLIGQIGYRNLNPSLSSSLLLRRRVQVSAYDKNPDEPIHNPSLIPDEAISPKSDKYWAPHPKTGVFSPSSENPALTAEEHGFRGDNNAGSVLEEKAFFRPLEDLEKPAPN